MPSGRSVQPIDATFEAVLPVDIALLLHERAGGTHTGFRATELKLHNQSILQRDSSVHRPFAGFSQIHQVLDRAFGQPHGKGGMDADKKEWRALEQRSPDIRMSCEQIVRFCIGHPHICQGDVMTAGAAQPAGEPRIFYPPLPGRQEDDAQSRYAIPRARFRNTATSCDTKAIHPIGMITTTRKGPATRNAVAAFEDLGGAGGSHGARGPDIGTFPLDVLRRGTWKASEQQ